MTTMQRTLLATIAAALFAACASTPPTPETMSEAGADFSAYKTFGRHASGDDKPGQPTSIVDGYVRTAIANELKGKGYVEAPAGTSPDLTIAYEGASAEKLKNKPFRVGVGVGSYGSSGGGSVGVGSSSVEEVKEGTLVVHVIDPARETEIWRGSIARELNKGGVQESAVQSAVAELMREFPARGINP